MMMVTRRLPEIAIAILAPLLIFLSSCCLKCPHMPGSDGTPQQKNIFTDLSNPTPQSPPRVNMSRVAYVAYYFYSRSSVATVKWDSSVSRQNIWIFLCSYSNFLSNHPLVVFVGTEVEEKEAKMIEAYGAEIRRVRIFPNLDPRPQIEESVSERMTKFNVWSLVEYDRIIFLDLDAWPIRDISALFQIPLTHGQAAIAIPKGSGLGYKVNTGVMVIKPSLTTYGFLMSTYLSGNYPIKLDHFTKKQYSDDQVLLQWMLSFDQMHLSFNFKYPRALTRIPPKNLSVLHDVLEHKGNFQAYARFHKWENFNNYLRNVQAVTANYCPNLWAG